MDYPDVLPQDVLKKFGMKPSRNSDIKGLKYQLDLKDDVEQTKDLIAVHNIPANKLADVLRLRGLPMPSIAVTKAAMGWDNFGEYSMIFNKNTIAPEVNRKNGFYKPTAAEIQKIADILQEVREMPVNMFEAKPQRVVDFSEVVTVLAPKDGDQELANALHNAGMTTIEYDPNEEGDRLRKLQSVENVRFSLTISEDGETLYDKDGRDYFYDINKIKEGTTQHVQDLRPSSDGALQPSFDKSISSEANKNKPKLSYQLNILENGKGNIIQAHDSEGTELTEAQREFFKDSKAVNEKGELIPYYHGSNSIEYDPNEEGDRLRKLQSIENVRFSLTISEDGETLYDKNERTIPLIKMGLITDDDLQKDNLAGTRKVIRDLLRELNGEKVEIRSDSRTVTFNSRTAREYTNSNSTKRLKTDGRRTKFSAIEKIKEIVANASDPRWEENNEEKHILDAERGWTKYKVVFGTEDNGETRIFSGELKIKMSGDGTDYVYDIAQIKEAAAHHVTGKIPTHKVALPASEKAASQRVPGNISSHDRAMTTSFDQNISPEANKNKPKLSYQFNISEDDLPREDLIAENADLRRANEYLTKIEEGPGRQIRDFRPSNDKFRQPSSDGIISPEANKNKPKFSYQLNISEDDLPREDLIAENADLRRANEYLTKIEEGPTRQIRDFRPSNDKLRQPSSDESISSETDGNKHKISHQLNISEDDLPREDLIAENADLRRANEYLTGMLNTYKNLTPSDKDIHRVVKSLADEFSVEGDLKPLEAKVGKFYTYLRTAQRIDGEEVTRVSAALANEMLDKAEHTDPEAERVWKEFRKTMRSMRIYIPESNIADYAPDSWNTFRKEWFGKIAFTKNKEFSSGAYDGQAVYRRLQQQFPDYFTDSAEDMTDDEAIHRIMEAFELQKPMPEPVYVGADRDEVAVILGQRIIEGYVGVGNQDVRAQYNKSYKEITRQIERKIKKDYIEELSAQRIENAGELKKLNRRLQNQEIGLEAYVVEKKALLDYAQQERQAAAKRWRKTRSEYEDSQKKSAYKKEILRNTEKLTRMINQPTDKAHVPMFMLNDLKGVVDYISFALDPQKKDGQLKQWAQDGTTPKLMKSGADLKAAFARVTDGVQDIVNNGSVYIDGDGHEYYVVVDPDIITCLKQIPDMLTEEGAAAESLDKLSVYQMQIIRDTMASLNKMVEVAGQFISNEHYKSVNEAAEKTIDELSKMKSATNLQGKMLGGMQSMFRSGMVDAYTYFDAMGESGKAIYDEVRTALDKKIRNTRTAQDYMQEVKKREGITDKEINKWSTELKEIELVTRDRDGILRQKKTNPAYWCQMFISWCAWKACAEARSMLPAKWIQQDDGTWTYRRADGAFARNEWQNIGGRWYVFDGSGTMIKGWFRSGEAWYYLGEDGGMLSGQWFSDKGKNYYLTDSGAMATDAYIGSEMAVNGKRIYYYVDGSGVWRPEKDTENPPKKSEICA